MHSQTEEEFRAAITRLFDDHSDAAQFAIRQLTIQFISAHPAVVNDELIEAMRICIIDAIKLDYPVQCRSFFWFVKNQMQTHYPLTCTYPWVELRLPNLNKDDREDTILGYMLAWALVEL